MRDVSAVEQLSPNFAVLLLNVDQNSLMTMGNVRTCLIVDAYLRTLYFLLLKVVFKILYPNDYTPDVLTRVSNSLLVGKNHLFYSTITMLLLRIIQVLSLDKLW